MRSRMAMMAFALAVAPMAAVGEEITDSNVEPGRFDVHALMEPGQSFAFGGARFDVMVCGSPSETVVIVPAPRPPDQLGGNAPACRWYENLSGLTLGKAGRVRAFIRFRDAPGAPPERRSN
ncbi:MAG TPA: hypothetical protein VII63_05415 [Caulobacteraceae bacterium]